jgi:hypothetical protein
LTTHTALSSARQRLNFIFGFLKRYLVGRVIQDPQRGSQAALMFATPVFAQADLAR